MRKKKVKATNCIDVQRVLHSVQIRPERLISFLELVCSTQESRLQTLKEQGAKYPALEQDLTEYELELHYAQSLLYVLKIAQVEGYHLQYVNPSDN